MTSCYAWGTNVQELGDCLKTPELIPALSGRADDVQGVAAFGEKMLVALTEGGALYGAGASAYGQFASDTPLDPDSGTQWKGWHPLERFSGESITAMACSEFHGVAVTEDRKVYSWGVNSLFNTGDDYDDGVLLGGISMPEKILWTSPKPQLIPRCVSVLDKASVRQVACGRGHTLALTDGGDVYSWGAGWNGCLGLGQGEQSVLVPTLIEAFNEMHIIQVACGKKFSMAVTTTGYLFGWGRNANGQLGLGDESETEDVPQPVDFFGEGPVCVTQVACGSVHAVASDVKGRVFTWGSNIPLQGQSSILIGRLGHGSPCQLTPRHVTTGALEDLPIQMVSCGADHTAVLAQDGTVVFCGFLRRPRDWAEDGYGPIGTATQIIPVVINGPWSGTSAQVCYIASGDNKVLVLTESPEARSHAHALLAEVEQVHTVAIGDGASNEENAELRRQLAAMQSKLNHADALCKRYLPMFSADM